MDDIMSNILESSNNGEGGTTPLFVFRGGLDRCWSDLWNCHVFFKLVFEFVKFINMLIL